MPNTIEPRKLRVEDFTDGLIPETSAEGSVSAKTFRSVSAVYLLENWDDLHAAATPIFHIKERTVEAFHVSVLTRKDLDSMTSSERAAASFAIPSQWLAGNRFKQFSFGWDRDPFFLRWHALLDIIPEERVELFRKARNQTEARLKEERDPVARAKLIASVTETAFLANKACMSLEKTSLDKNDQELVRETILTVQSVLSAIEESKLSSTLMLALRSISSGQVIDHVVRVFTTGTAFLLYLKKLHTQNLALRLRAAFPAVYKNLYRKVLPRVPENRLTSDNVFRFRSYSEEEIREQALGILLHDLGKAMDIGYFESEAKYDDARVKQHSILGSGLFLRTYGQKFEQARYIIGDHHNYLLHPDGYGLSRWDRFRGGRGLGEPEASVGDTLESYLEGQTLAYLPIEVCSQCDVFDALTDPRRAYQQIKSASEAIELMASDFVLKGKFDPIVFDLFVEFMKTTGLKTSWPGFEDRIKDRTAW